MIYHLHVYSDESERSNEEHSNYCLGPHSGRSIKCYIAPIITRACRTTKDTQINRQHVLPFENSRLSIHIHSICLCICMRVESPLISFLSVCITIFKVLRVLLELL